MFAICIHLWVTFRSRVDSLVSMTVISVVFLILLMASFTVCNVDEFSFTKEMMYNVCRRFPDKPCYTPHDMEDKFSRACQKVLGDEPLCDGAWDAFTSAFKFKDPNTVIDEDYNRYFDFIPIVSAPNSSLFWSGVPSVVEAISKHRNISSSFNQASSSIFNIMSEEFNVTCWCGNKTAVLDMVNPCPVEPTVGFWKSFSAHFGESGKTVVFWIGDGNREGGAYQNTSFFTTVEFPRLTYPRVIRLIAMDIYDCGHKTVESCEEGTMRLLGDEAVKKYGSMGYKCVDVCGDPLHKREVPLLAEKALKIIREAQNAGDLVYTMYPFICDCMQNNYLKLVGHLLGIVTLL